MAELPWWDGWASEPAADETDLPLVHPVYLDVPMMVSFVAALEGGVAYGDERTEKRTSGTDKDREGKVGVGIPILSSLLSLDMSGRLAQKDREEGSEEVKVVRRHTEASLFNLLRARLATEGQITAIDDAAQLASLKPGDLVEVPGEVIGNPLQQMFDLLRQFLPYMGLDEEELRKPKKQRGRPAASGKGKGPKSQAPAQADMTADGNGDGEMSMEEVVRMLFVMRDDLESASVRDLVLLGPDGVRAALTLSTEFFSDQTTDYISGGDSRLWAR